MSNRGKLASRLEAGGLAQCVDSGAKALGELICLTHCHPGGIDGLTYSKREGPGKKMARVHGQQIIDAAQRKGNQRNLRSNGQKGSAREEGLEFAVGCAPAFRKDK